MENLRWILIFAGVAILLLLYFSGRPSGSAAARANARRPRPSRARDLENGLGLDSEAGHDPLLGARGADALASGPGGYDAFVVDPDDLERPAAARARAPQDFEAPEPDYLSERAPASAQSLEADAPLPPELEPEPRGAGIAGSAAGAVGVAAGAFGGLSQRIEAIGAKLSHRRNERVAASAPDDDADEEAPAFASKIVTLHVVARDDATFDGQALLDCFERRELTFGEMNIFHSMHHDKTVFSVAKMVEPGWFDPHDLDSFATPGITLILQLPGPVAADTAFEVLLSEAFEIARELGGTVLDGERSTLSKQTAQHMREGIYEYMHRQKYFGSVAS